MPIIIDFSQVVIRAITVNLSKEASGENPNAKSLIRHMVFSLILQYKKKYSDYGKLILCCDAKTYWRRTFFKYYKGDRVQMREKSPLDWKFIAETINEVKEEIKTNSQYCVLEVDDCEADDLVAVLCKYFNENELTNDGLFDGEPQPIMIISSDGDFVQLQKYKNVKQFSPIIGKQVVPKTSIAHYLIEHIVRASDDGIPNILSADNCLVDKVRQTSIKQAYLQNFIDKGGKAACESELEKRNWTRNQTLIDFEFIPPYIQDNIVKAYTEYETKGSKTKLMNYFLANKMRVAFSELGNY